MTSPAPPTLSCTQLQALVPFTATCARSPQSRLRGRRGREAAGPPGGASSGRDRKVVQTTQEFGLESNGNGKRVSRSDFWFHDLSGPGGKWIGGGKGDRRRRGTS